MKHNPEHTPGESPVKKKPNIATKNRFEHLKDEVCAGTDDSRSQSPVSTPDRSAGPSGAGNHTASPPDWFLAFEARQAAQFKAFEERQNNRLETILGLCKEDHQGLLHEINILKDEVAKLSLQLGKADEKIDDLENRGRRNNIVLFNVPEGKEENNCLKFVEKILSQADCKDLNSHSIQRAHRTGKQPAESASARRPRPIHIGFSNYREKMNAKKSLISLFKKQGTNSNQRYSVSDDFSARVQKMRREKLGELKRLRSEGKNAQLVFPAEIRVFKN